MASDIQSKRIIRILEFFFFQWLANTGRIVILCLSFGRLKLPKTDFVSYEEQLSKCHGIGNRIWLTIKLMAAEEVCFIVGALTWALFAILSLLAFVSIFGPIHPVHTWGA